MRWYGMEVCGCCTSICCCCFGRVLIGYLVSWVDFFLIFFLVGGWESLGGGGVFGGNVGRGLVGGRGVSWRELEAGRGCR